MAGLDSEGFIPYTFEEISERIGIKLETFSAGIDLSPESPDGQLISIIATELEEAWLQLAEVYNSFDPLVATGAALKNLGLISGHPYSTAARSTAPIDLIGTAGTFVNNGSVVSDAEGNLFNTEFDAVIPASVNVIAQQAGIIPVAAGTIINIETPVVGWSSISQGVDGIEGKLAQSDTAYRNTRNRTVERQHIGTIEVIKARLLELGVEQVSVINNITGAPLPDGTPDKNIHVTLAETVGIADEDIARVILLATPLGTPTFGSTTINIDDSQGNSQEVKFSKAVEVPIVMDIDITFLSTETAGATDDIKAALAKHVNSLLAGEDVIWSRLYEFITPFGKAQVNSLQIGKTIPGLGTSNIVIAETEFASSDIADIVITET